MKKKFSMLIFSFIISLTIQAQGINILTDTFKGLSPSSTVDSTTTFEKFDVPEGQKRLLILWSELNFRSDIIADATLNGEPLTTFIYNVRNGPVGFMAAGGGHQFWYAALGTGAGINECLVSMTRGSGQDPATPFTPATALDTIRYMILDNVDQDDPIGQVEATNDTYVGEDVGTLSYNFNPQLFDMVFSFHQTAAASPACLPGTGGFGDSLVHNITTIIEGKGSQETAVSAAIATADDAPVLIEWSWYDRMTNTLSTQDGFINQSFEVNFCRTLIPTLSQWGIISLSLLLLIFGAIRLQSSRKRNAAIE